MSTQEERVWYERVRPVFEAVCAVPREQWSRALAEQERVDAVAADEVRRLLLGNPSQASDPEISRAWSVLLGRAQSRISTPPPDRIGPYRILERIDGGGMGEVFLAQQDDGVQLRVALKVMQDWLRGERATARFRQEQEVLARLNHPYIAKVHFADVTDADRPYFAMEFVEGAAPITAYADQAALDLRARLWLFQKVCAGVHYAHLKAVVHCDLKPGNVLVTTQSGEAVPKIIDFGLARLRDAGNLGTTTIGGTLEYMAPEQARGDPSAVDVRCDVHALGVILYELVVGALPIGSEVLRSVDLVTAARTIERTVAELPSRRLEKAPARGKLLAGKRRSSAARLLGRVAGELDWIVMKALAKEPDRRYESAKALEEDLERFLTAQPIEARPPSRMYRVRKFVHRHAAAVAMLTVLFVGLTVALFGVTTARASELAEAAQGAVREARLAMRNTRWQEAMAALDRAIGLGYPDPADLVLDKVECLEAMQRPAESLGLLRTVPAGLSPAVEARRLLLTGALGADRFADPDAGAAEMRQALAMHESSLASGAGAVLPPASVEYLRGMLADDLEELLVHLREAVRLDPFHLLACCELVGVELLWGDPVRVTSLCEAARGRRPDYSWFVFLGDLAAVAAGKSQGRQAVDEEDAAQTAVLALTDLLRVAERVVSAEIDNMIRPAFGEEKVSQWAGWVQVTAAVQRTINSLAAMQASGVVDSTRLSRMSGPVRRAFDPILGLIRQAPQMILSGKSAGVRRQWLEEVTRTSTADLDGVVLLLRATLRLEFQSDSEKYRAIHDDLSHADSVLLRLLPSLRRVACFLRMACLRAMQTGLGDQDPEKGRLRLQALDVATLVEQLPDLGTREVLYHAVVLADVFGEVEAAVRILRIGNRQSPNDASILTNLALLTQRLGKTEEARKLWRHVLAEVPNDPRAVEQLRRLDSGSESSGTGK